MITGPKPKPTAQKELEGNPGHRPINKSEPQPDVLPPTALQTPPEHLTDVGKAKWTELTAQFAKSKMLTVLDTDLLTTYCRLCQDEKVLTDLITSEGGLILTGEKGGKYANPAWNMLQSTRSMMFKIMAELGMTPSSRTRMSVPDEKPKGKLGKYRGTST